MPRDANGRFVKGASGNPRGRPQMELSVSALIDRAVTVEDWQEIISRLLIRARRGDLKAVEILFDRRFGKATQPTEANNTGEIRITVQHVRADNPNP